MEVLLSTGVRTIPLTHEEEFLLKLAAYLLRAGRIDNLLMKMQLLMTTTLVQQ